MPEHPQQIGKYEIRSFLGGGMSHVYKAWDPVMNRVVAVKILTPEANRDAEARARFLREAQTAGGLQHDNVMRVYDFGEEAGCPFMVMEFLEGEDLREAIRSGRVGDARRRLEIAVEGARALEYIHTREIVHRDIKPENLHVDRNGRVRLMDFGIAKRPDMTITRAGYTLGTPYYMSPEQVNGDNVTHRADIYSYGILLYELFTGDRPITADTVEQLFYRILHVPVDLAPLREAGAPEAICRLVERCTAKSPDARPGDFGEVRAELEQALRGPASAPAPAQPPRPVEAPGPAPVQGRMRWWIPAAAAVLAVAAVVVFVVTRGKPSPPPAVEPVVQAPPAPPALLSTPSGEMVLVAEGRFLFGRDRQPVSLPAYYIDRTEVTNRAYGLFCQEKGHALPEGFSGAGPDLPVVNVTIYDAREFAAWAGKRLPGAKEWEKAARGSDGRSYPWGERNDPKLANVREESGPVPPLLPAAALPGGASPCGAVQMAGNVWEFVDEQIQPSEEAVWSFASLLKPPPGDDEQWFTMRGGSHRIPLVADVAVEWAAVPGRFKAPDIGFRCIRELR